MRTEINGNITVVYPDALVAAFARNPITVEGYTGTAVELIVTNGSESRKERRALFNGSCFFDLSYYLQVMFDTDTFNVEYTGMNNANTAKEFTVTVGCYNGTTNEASFTFSLMAVWASVLNEGNEKLTMFKGYPFTVGVYSDGTAYVSADGVETLIMMAGVHNVPVTYAQTVSVEDGTGSKTIEVREVCVNGIYLRWIDRTGIFRYWMFKQGDVTTKVQQQDEFIRKNTGTDYGKRRLAKEAGTSVEVCAPLVDGDTFAFLLGVTISPIVDMYSNGEWVAVDIDADSIVRERASCQHFVVNVVLPDTIVQKL